MKRYLVVLLFLLAPPARAQNIFISPTVCPSHTYIHITSNTDTLLVQGVAGQTVRICGVKASFSGSAAQSIYLENVASTAASCSATKTQITGLMTGNSSAPNVDGFYGATWAGLANTLANGVCVNSSGSGGVDVDVWYLQGPP